MNTNYDATKIWCLSFSVPISVTVTVYNDAPHFNDATGVTTDAVHRKTSDGVKLISERWQEITLISLNERHPILNVCFCTAFQRLCITGLHPSEHSSRELCLPESDD